MTQVYSRGNPDLTAAVGPARPDGLFEMAEAVLGRLRSVAVGAGVQLPVKQVIYPSQVPVDCDQVSVLLQGWAPHVQAGVFMSCQTFKWAAILQVAITRCSPGGPDKRGKLPTAEAMTDAARIASKDATLLQNLVATFEEIGPEITLLVQPPDGGFQTVELTVTLTAFGSLD